MTIKFIWAALAFAIICAGCGGSTTTVNAFTVYDDRTMSCEQARKILVKVPDRDRKYLSTRRAAASKLNWCEAAGQGGAYLIVGEFDPSAKGYVFKRISVEDATQVRRLCLDVATANYVLDTPPANLAFHVQMTIAGDTQVLPCDRFAGEMWQSGVTVLIAPAHLPLLMDIDPVLVLATGVNSRLEGVPHRYYDEVKDMLKVALADLGV